MTPRAIVFGLTVAACTAAVAAHFAAGSPYSGHAFAVDGDTLRVSGHAIRLAGVDAEELSEPHGHTARAALTAIITGRTVSCRPVGKSHDRIVATCTVDGRDVGGELIRQGFALDCARYSQGRYRALEPPTARATLLQKPYC